MTDLIKDLNFRPNYEYDGEWCLFAETHETGYRIIFDTDQKKFIASSEYLHGDGYTFHGKTDTLEEAQDILSEVHIKDAILAIKRGIIY